MKRSITSEEHHEIPLPVEGVTNDSLIGIEWSNRDRSMVIAIEGGIFVSTCTEGCANKWSRRTKQDYVRAAIGKEGTAFVFSTEKELLLWLAGEEYKDSTDHITLTNEDLLVRFKNHNISEITLSNFKAGSLPTSNLFNASMITYVDRRVNEFVILKTRYKQIEV